MKTAEEHPEAKVTYLISKFLNVEPSLHIKGDLLTSAMSSQLYQVLDHQKIYGKLLDQAYN